MSATDRAVAAYLSAVRNELADLPATERDDLLQEVEANLAEVAAELPEPTEEALVERLGTAAEYVAQLRESAGYDKAAAAPAFRRARSTSKLPRKSLWLLLLSCALAPFMAFPALGGDQAGLLLTAAMAATPAVIAVLLARGADPYGFEALPEVQWTKGMLRRLRPVDPPPLLTSALPHVRTTWLVLRGWVAALVFGALLGIGWEMVPLPHLTFQGLFGAALIAAGIAGSFLLAKLTSQDRRWLWIILPLNVAAAAALVVAPSAYDAATQRMEAASAEYENVVPTGGLYGPDGEQITNLYLFDKDGRPLTDVFVYDQDGKALQLPRDYCRQDDTDPGSSYVQTTDRGDNRYPRPRIHEDYDEPDNQTVCRTLTGVPFTVNVPSPAPPTSTPVPTPTPTPTPTGTPTPAKRPTPTK